MQLLLQSLLLQVKPIPFLLGNHQITLSLLLNTGHNHLLQPTTVTAPPGGTDTVIIREPPNHTVTTTEYWSQSYATTTTITAPPGETDTVLIENHQITQLLLLNTGHNHMQLLPLSSHHQVKLILLF